jgi:serine/threonine-protein kinase
VYDVAKLLDFGLVKEGGGTSDDTGGRSGSFSGTPLYMSPEQAAAYEDVDGRADLYSLGAVAYYVLTGQPPFTSQSVVELLAAHRNKPIAPPSQLQPEIPSDLEQIILRCMAKSPADRFPDAASLADALGQCSVAGQWGPEQAAKWWRSC